MSQLLFWANTSLKRNVLYTKLYVKSIIKVQFITGMPANPRKHKGSIYEVCRSGNSGRLGYRITMIRNSANAQLSKLLTVRITRWCKKNC